MPSEVVLEADTVLVAVSRFLEACLTKLVADKKILVRTLARMRLRVFCEVCVRVEAMEQLAPTYLTTRQG